MSQFNTILQAKQGEVLGRERECLRGEVRCGDLRLNIGLGGDDRQAGSTRTQVKHPGNAVRVRLPRFKSTLQDLGNRRAGHQRASIAQEPPSCEPRLSTEVGQRRPLADSRLQQLFNLNLLAGIDRRIRFSIDPIDRYPDRNSHQPDRLVMRIVATMAEREFGCIQPVMDAVHRLCDGVHRGS